MIHICFIFIIFLLMSVREAVLPSINKRWCVFTSSSDIVFIRSRWTWGRLITSSLSPAGSLSQIERSLAVHKGERDVKLIFKTKWTMCPRKLSPGIKLGPATQQTVERNYISINNLSQIKRFGFFLHNCSWNRVSHMSQLLRPAIV